MIGDELDIPFTNLAGLSLFGITTNLLMKNDSGVGIINDNKSPSTLYNSYNSFNISAGNKYLLNLEYYSASYWVSVLTS